MSKTEKTRPEESGKKGSDFEGQSFLKIKRSDEKISFWKPKKKGDMIEGKLVSISEGNFGKVLKLSTKKGIVGINVNVFLEDIDFSQFANERLRFVFKGEVGKRGCRVYDVDQVVGEDEVPF